MRSLAYTLEETVAVVTMNAGDNVFNPPFLNDLLEILDQVETDTDATALVITSADEKIFSNGIDLLWLEPKLKQGDLQTAKAFFFQLNRVFSRLLTYPLFTIAAISGHAFAGGAIFSSAFDFRFMQTQKGFFCLPEVDLGIPFLPGMNAMLGKAIPRYILEEMQYTGIRLTAEMCETHHIIRKACVPESLMAETLAFAKTLTKKRSVVAELKRRLNAPILQIIEIQDPPIIESGKYYIA